MRMLEAHHSHGLKYLIGRLFYSPTLIFRVKVYIDVFNYVSL